MIAKLKFTDECIPGTPEAFRARMEAQCEEIERYQQEVLKEQGRDLSLDEAAREWIENNADNFARDHDTD